MNKWFLNMLKKQNQQICVCFAFAACKCSFWDTLHLHLTNIIAPGDRGLTFYLSQLHFDFVLCLPWFLNGILWSWVSRRFMICFDSLMVSLSFQDLLNEFQNLEKTLFFTHLCYLVSPTSFLDIERMFDQKSVIFNKLTILRSHRIFSWHNNVFWSGFPPDKA